MKAHWGLVLVILIWPSIDVEAQSGLDDMLSFPDQIMLNASNYDVSISLLSHQVGDYLTTVGVVYNVSIFEELISVTYKVVGSYHAQVAIDQNGRTTVTKKFLRVSAVSIEFSATVVARVSGNITFTEYLEGRILVRVLDAVYFTQSQIVLRLPGNAVAGDHVFDMTSVVVVDRENFVKSRLSFFSLGRWYRSYSFYLSSRGKLTLGRKATEINPGTHFMSVHFCYRLTMRNGTQRSRCLVKYVLIRVIGCHSAAEGNVQWPTLHTCQAATHPCVKYHPLFKGGSVVRECSTEGKTLKLDFSNCSVLQSDFSTPFAVVWFTFTGTDSSTYIGALPAIKRDVGTLFPSSKVTSIRMFSAFRSSVNYGFTMAMVVKLLSTTTQGDIAAAHRSLGYARSIGGQRLGSKGLRAFVPSAGCKTYSDAKESFLQFVPICQQKASSDCNCVDNVTIMPTPTLSCPTKLTITDEPTPTVTPSPTPEPDIHFTQSHYRAKYFASPANRGTQVTKITLKVEHPQLIKSWTHNFGLHGFYSDYFSIGHTSGVITVASAVQAKLYTFDVTAFIRGNFTNGTSFTNFTEADVSILVHDGAYFNKLEYPVSVNADLSKNTPVFSLQKELIQDKTAVQQILSVEFTRQSSNSEYFKVSKEGVISTALPLNPMDTNTTVLTVSATFQAIDMNGEHFQGQASTRIAITVKGCGQEEGGGHVWPVMHFCGIATVNCSEFDNAFDQYGVIKRQCTKEGYWLSPDFSQCRLKSGTSPFVLLWMTFASSSTRHWQSSHTESAIRELRLYMGTLPVSTITVHYSKKSKIVRGHVQSFKVTLRPQGPFNDTDLQSLKKTISQKSAINYRPIFTGNYTFGVLGFIPSEYCPNIDRMTPDPHYKSVCSGSGVACRCAEDDLFEPSECCTVEGKMDRSEKCNATATIPPKTCKSADAALTVSFRVSSRQLNISWTVTSGDWPDSVSVNVLFRGFHEERKFVTTQSSLTTSTSVSGLLPSTVHVVTVIGTYDEPGCSYVSETYVIKTTAEDDMRPVTPFQMLLNGVTSCAEVKAKLQSDVRQWIISGVQGTDATFTSDRIGWLFMECPSGLSPTSAVISGWIYGNERDPADKYVRNMQKMADKHATIEVGSQKLSMDPACSVSLTTPTPPDHACRTTTSSNTGDAALTSSDSGSSVAGTVVGIIIGIFICVVLALILIALILKFKRDSKNSSAAPSTGVAPVTLKETKKQEEEDEVHLEEDF